MPFLSFSMHIVLTSPNFVVTKQVMELMACLCVYSIDGYDTALDILKTHQVSILYL